jgi:VWFA-related protein
LPAVPPPAPPQTSPEEPPPHPPTFTAATKLVQVDVIARRKGTPANGLTKDDFTLLDNGKPQNIAVFSVTSSQTSGPDSVPLPAGAVSNRLERGGDSLANATVVLIDRINTAPADQDFAIQRIVKFLSLRRNKNSKPDQIGIYTLGRGGLRAVQEITGDAGLLRRAADSLIARDTSYEHGPDHVTATKRALEAIARHLASVPGRKGLIWVTGGFPLSTPAFDSNADMDEAARALNDADVALYAVDARGLVGSLSGMTAISNAESRGPESTRPLSPLRFMPISVPGGSPDGIEAMTKLAGLTGGLALYNTNGIEDSIRKALDDAELTYTLGFYPGQQDQDGVWHKLKIEVARPGVSVRYRGKYYASGSLAANGSPTLPELLKAPLDATQLQVVAETMPDRARPDFRQVRVSVDLHQVHLENQNDKWAGAVDVSFFVEGSRIARTITGNLEIPDVQLAAALKRGIEVEDSIGVGGQTGQLRIVAQDRATGAAGSVRVPLSNK